MLWEKNGVKWRFFCTRLKTDKNILNHVDLSFLILLRRLCKLWRSVDPLSRFRTCDQLHLTSNLTWNPKSVNQQELTHDEYNNLVSHAKDRKVCSVNLKKLIHRMRDARMSNWYKYNNYFLYPGENLMKDTIWHYTRVGKWHNTG